MAWSNVESDKQMQNCDIFIINHTQITTAKKISWHNEKGANEKNMWKAQSEFLQVSHSYSV